MLFASYRKWEKIPFLEPRAIGYRMGPKIGIFSQCRHRARSLPVSWQNDPCLVRRAHRSKLFCEKNIRDSYTRYSQNVLSPTGISVAWRPGRAPGPDPPEAPPGPPGIISTTLTLFGPPEKQISSRFSRGKSGYRKKGGFFRH